MNQHFHCFRSKVSLDLSFHRVFHGQVKHRTTIFRAIEAEYGQYRRQVCSQTGKQRKSAFLAYKEQSSVLFECIKNGAELEERQAAFLHDQRNMRSSSVMEAQITWQMEDEIENERNAVEDRMELGESLENDDRMEEDSLEDRNQEIGETESEEESESEIEEESQYNYFVLRNGKRLKLAENDPSISTEVAEIPLRIGVKCFLKSCIEAIVQMNVQCHCSISMARKAFVLIENKFNGQNYTLEPNEKEKSTPRTSDDFGRYKNVVPSEKTLLAHRHNYALCKYIVLDCCQTCWLHFGMNWCYS